MMLALLNGWVSAAAVNRPARWLANDAVNEPSANLAPS